MLDGSVRPLIDPPLNAAGMLLARLGVGANAITLAGFLLGGCACAAIAFWNVVRAAPRSANETGRSG